MAKWTDERVDLLGKLWNDGVSAAQIARQLGGLSRNAVIGKIHRMGLSNRPKPTVPGHAKAAVLRASKARLRLAGRGSVFEQAETPPPRADFNVSAFEPLPGTTPRPWITRAFGECSWPVGDDMSCCAPTHKRGWCRFHFFVGTQPPAKKKAATDRRWVDHLAKRFAA